MTDEKKQGLETTHKIFAILGIVFAMVAGTATFMNTFFVAPAHTKNEQLKEVISQNEIMIGEFRATLAKNEELLEELRYEKNLRESASKINEPQKIELKSEGVNSPNLLQQGSGNIDVSYSINTIPLPSYPEPTSEDIKRALVAELSEKGGTSFKGNTLNIGSLGKGMSLEFLNVERLSCRPAVEADGYICDYKTISRVEFYSDERIPDPMAQALTFNIFTKILTKGTNKVETTRTRRFFKNNDVWLVAP